MSSIHKPQFSASMMCANYLIFEQEVIKLDEAKIDLYHIDIMDGMFVDNFSMSDLEMKAISSISNTKLDIHMMVSNPKTYIDKFAVFNPEYISIHYETDRNIHGTLTEIRKHGIKTGVAINPGTSFKLLEPLLEMIDMVLVMTVNPGFAGQSFINTSVKKTEALRKWLDELGFNKIKIQVDGSIGIETAKQLRIAGADIFVLGTSGLFKDDMNYKKNLSLLREVVE